jgi:HAMP domain-containing protein
MSTSWSASFLRTRVARRILALFLLCAVVPVAGLSTLGYRFVADQLENDATLELRSQSKTAGMLLLDRLASLAASLERTATLLSAGQSYLESVNPSSAAIYASRFQALAVRHADGSVTALRGDIRTFPALSTVAERQLRETGMALVVGPEAQAPHVYMVHALDGRPEERLWGELNPSSVWGSDQGRSPAPPGTLMCLATADGVAISCPDIAALTMIGRPDDGSAVSWSRDGEDYLAGRWMIFLGRMYGAPSWTVMLSRPVEEVFAPLRTLLRTFVLGLLLSLALVFTLSHILLRRTMTPLEALGAGTRRLADGNFTEPVQVTSGDEFESLATSFNTMASELQRQFGTRQALQEVGRAALEAEGPETVLTTLFARSATLLGPGNLSAALAVSGDPSVWRTIDARGHASGEAPLEVRPEQWELEELLGNTAGFVVQRGAKGRSYFVRGEAELGCALIVLPILRKGVLSGALVLESAPGGAGSQATLERARRYADPIGVALVNTQLVDQLEALNWGALTALARAIDAVSPWTAGHSERVTLGALEIGRQLALPDRDLDILHRGGLLHDVGKVGVPAALLDKPGKLEPEEYEIIKRHPEIGAKILAPIAAFRDVLPLVLHHHELLDGSGYPHRLAGDQIPLLVRIMTVADVYDALTSERPYRAAWHPARAIAYLRESADVRFDARVVEALATAVDAGWQPEREGRPLELPAQRVSHRYSLWPEADRPRTSQPVATGTVEVAGRA